jgi:parvulin-like peptidyl-prolyl isomerase
MTRCGVRARVRAVATPVLAAALLVACGSSPASPAAPGPVAKVGSQSIPRSLFDLRMASALTAIQQGGGPQKGSAGYDAMISKLRASVLKSLIIDSVIAQEAAFRHIAATDADVQKQFDDDVRAAGSLSTLQTQLSEAGGSADQLRDEIRSRINEQRLEDQFAGQRAAAILQQLATGVDFATLAKQLSDDDTSNTKGGDLGVMTTGQLDQGDATFAAAVRTAPVGHVLQAPVRDTAGYELIRVDSATVAGFAVRRILVAAPQTYTVKERPAWFLQSLVDAIAQYCSQGKLSVMISNADQPCVAASASPGTGAGASSPAASASASPTP